MKLFELFKEFICEIYAYREYLKQSVARDMRKTYKRSFLGYFWSMLNPLFMMIILAVVFSNIMRSTVDDYAVFLFCGMLPWMFFDGTSQGCLASIRANARIIDQIPVPKFIFPVAIAAYNLVTFFLSLLPLFLVMIFLGRQLPITILALPVVILPLFIFSMGTALIFAVANVFFEDTQHLVGVLLRALYFLCPILYSREMLPDWLAKWVVLNPMFCIIEFMRDLFYHGTMPPLSTYCINLLGSMIFLVFGLWLFKKTEDKFLYFI